MQVQLTMFSDNSKPHLLCKLSEADCRELVALYTTRDAQGHWRSARQIAAVFGVTLTTVLNYLRRAGVPTRTSLETRGQRACRPIKNLPVGEPPPCRCGCGLPSQWLRRKNRWGQFAVGHFSTTYNLPTPARHHPVHQARQRRTVNLPALEWLYTEYVDNLRTLSEIATSLHIGGARLRRYAEACHLPLRSHGESLVMRGSVSKARNGAWKGGIAKWEYAPDWKRIARRIRKRDGYTCQLCFKTLPKSSKVLHVHHIDEDKAHNADANLVTVCASCHPKGTRRSQEVAAILAARGK